MILFEIDPNIVKPGWTPLLITIALAGVMVLLYLSMRRQFRKIHTLDSEAAEPGVASTADAVRPSGPRDRPLGGGPQDLTSG